ncbi:unnamed protein product [Nezara viridula]|uniref:Uncharacterized protein n=1 Tax=Nezara viridula TaxID=85310 RepID=A0A9P0H555_NEZVI|nr:unnamed protein product [Nezara viridula]CAH1395617.1 unnamed protein product [Nezara viridula]
MTDSCEGINFYVPGFIRSTFKGLLLPGQKLEEIFDQIGGLIFEGSNEIKPDETVWDSKTMTLNSKKPRTLDMFFKKVVKTEVESDVDSNYSRNSISGSVLDNSSIINRIKRSPDSTAQKSSSSKKVADTPSKKLKSKSNKSKSHQHSVSSSEDESTGQTGRNSPTYSVDLFAEDIQNSSQQPHKINAELSLSDEEITPSSQVHKSSGQTSLKKSNRQDSLDREISSSSSEEESEQPTLSKLDSIKTSMKNIKEVFSQIESNTEKFSFGDLTKDDELYILQCPSEIDCKKFEGVELTLEGNSVISIDGDSKYDCFSIKEKSKRCLYVALPDSNEQGMKLGVFQLSGNIILSENLGIPYTKPIEDNDYEHQDVPESKELKKQKKNKDDIQSDVSLEISNTSLNENFPSQHDLKKKKKKKKHRNTDDTLSDETAATECFSKDVNDVLNQLASKKKKSSDMNSRFSESDNVKTEYEHTQIIPDTEDQETPMKSKKKKKRRAEGTELNSSISDFSKTNIVKTDWEDSEIIPDTQDQGTLSKIKKKKNRSTEGTNWEDSQIIPDTQDQETPSKIKKKKKRGMEDTDLDSSFSNKLQLVKAEWENSQIIPDTQDQETPSKTKRKKKRSNEDTDLDSSYSNKLVKTDWEDSQIIQETPLKVKKKRRDKGDTTQDEATESEFFSENVTDVLNKLVTKKKKKKHYSLGSNEVTDYESEFEKSLKIKREREESQVISDFQETPSKSKKRSRKDVEDSEEFSKEYVPIKKKKKKYSHSGSQDML